MAVNFLINGYFRSGTSIVWQLIRQSNPDVLCFYEPCHKDLPYHLEQYISSPKAHYSHKFDLFSEYSNFKDISIIKEFHPNLGVPLPNTPAEVLNYIEIYNNFDKPTLLQTNRYHLEIQSIVKKFEINTPVQIIRHPQEVYESMIRFYSNEGVLYKRFFKESFPSIFNKRAFSILNTYLHLCNNGMLPFTKKLPTIEMFYASWIVLNHYALKQIDASNGFIIKHDILTQQPNSVRTILKDRLNLEFNYKDVLIQKNNTISWESSKDILSATALQLGIEAQLEELFLLIDDLG